MADTKISALSAVSSAATTDEFPVVQSGSTKKETNAQLITLLQTLNGLPIIKTLSSDASTNSTTTMAKITGLDLTLGAGTYYFKYMIRYQAAATTTGVKFAVNHSGTVTTFLANHSFSQALSTAASLAADQTISAGSVGLASYMGIRGANSVAGPTASTGAANSDMLWMVEGMMVVTVSGDLQLFHASEVAAATTVKASSHLFVTQVL